jgi:hypothetical protein
MRVFKDDGGFAATLKLRSTIRDQAQPFVGLSKSSFRILSHAGARFREFLENLG